MFYCNSRSLLNKLPLLYHLLDSKKFHVILFCETWLQDIHTDNLLVSGSGYNVFRYDRASRGGGVCIFTHPNLHIINHKAGRHHLVEYVVIELNLPNPTRLCCIYIPPQFSKSTSNIDELTYILGIIKTVDNEVVIMLKDKSCHSIIMKDANNSSRLKDFINDLLFKKKLLKSADFNESVLFVKFLNNLAKV